MQRSDWQRPTHTPQPGLQLAVNIQTYMMTAEQPDSRNLVAVFISAMASCHLPALTLKEGEVCVNQIVAHQKIVSYHSPGQTLAPGLRLPGVQISCQAAAAHKQDQFFLSEQSKTMVAVVQWT